jgi:hypothetical protein
VYKEKQTISRLSKKSSLHSTIQRKSNRNTESLKTILNPYHDAGLSSMHNPNSTTMDSSLLERDVKTKRLPLLYTSSIDVLKQSNHEFSSNLYGLNPDDAPKERALSTLHSQSAGVHYRGEVNSYQNSIDDGLYFSQGPTKAMS